MVIQLYYARPVDEVFKELNAGYRGLSTEEARKRLEKYGQNIFEKEKGVNILGIALHQFTDPLIYILIIAAFVTTYLDRKSVV